MKTAYYTFTAWNESAMAAGFDSGAAGSRQTTLVRQRLERARPAGGDKVIDLNAWRAGSLEPFGEEEAAEPEWAGEKPEELEPVLPAPRPRRNHHRAMFAAELAATLAVAGAAAALMLRVLMF